MKKSRVLLWGGLLTVGAMLVSVGVLRGGNGNNGNGQGAFGDSAINSSAVGDGSDFDPAAPWILPPGYIQVRVSDESDLDIYMTPTTGANSNDWHDMNTVNETGKHAGRYLYRTHEVRSVAENGGGVVSVVDLWTGETKVLVTTADLDELNAMFPLDALDGILWTPWGTLLIAEEVTNGRIFEVFLDPKDPSKAVKVVHRDQIGLIAHEGIEIGPDGEVYVVDEFRGEVAGFGGGIYKFVPDKYGDLSSGKLYALATDGPYGTGQGKWVGPIDPANARVDGTANGGATYNRPEDLEIIGDTLYAAITEGPRDGGTAELFRGRIISINLKTLQVKNFIVPGINVPEETATQSGFAKPDNLAKTADGKLVIVEDNVASDIWMAPTKKTNGGYAKNVWLFASLTDPSAEGTGIYFGKNPNVMFVNVQHSVVDDGDATWAIIKVGGGHGHHGHGRKGR